MSVLNYILDESDNPIQEPDFIKHAEWFVNNPRKKTVTELPSRLRVSTVFLGVSHGFVGDEPLVFETAIFHGDKLRVIVGRRTTWKAAMELHKETVKDVTTAEDDERIYRFP